MAGDVEGSDWTSDDLALTVANYFAMLQSELTGQPYQKAATGAGIASLPLRFDVGLLAVSGQGADRLLSLPSIDVRLQVSLHRVRRGGVHAATAYDRFYITAPAPSTTITLASVTALVPDERVTSRGRREIGDCRVCAGQSLRL